MSSLTGRIARILQELHGLNQKQEIRLVMVAGENLPIVGPVTMVVRLRTTLLK